MTVNMNLISSFVQTYGALASTEDAAKVSEIQEAISDLYRFDNFVFQGGESGYVVWKSNAWTLERLPTVTNENIDEILLGFKKTIKKIQDNLSNISSLVANLHGDQKSHSDLQPLQALKDRAIRALTCDVLGKRMCEILKINMPVYDKFLGNFHPLKNRYKELIEELPSDHFRHFIASHRVVIGQVPASVIGIAMDIFAKIEGTQFEPKIKITAEPRNGLPSIEINMSKEVILADEGEYSSEYRPIFYKPEDIKDQRLFVDRFGLQLTPPSKDGDVPYGRIATQIVVELLFRQQVSHCEVKARGPASFVLAAGGFKDEKGLPFPDLERALKIAKDNRQLFPPLNQDVLYTFKLSNLPDTKARFKTDISWSDLIKQQPLLSGTGPILPI